MEKKIKKFIILFIIFTIFNIFYINQSFARQVQGTTSAESSGGGGVTTINPSDYKPAELTEDSTVTAMGNRVIGAVQAVGSIASVVMLVVIGIKYMVGSVEEKAEYKNTMIYYIVGAILVFAISNISAIIYNWASTIN